MTTTDRPVRHCSAGDLAMLAFWISLLLFLYKLGQRG